MPRRSLNRAAAGPNLLGVLLLWCGLGQPARAQCEIAQLVACDGAPFGQNVSIGGRVVVIGAPGDDGSAVDAGAAYVHRWNGVAWVREARLTASDGAAQDYFGSSVAISGDVIVIGAPFAWEGEGNGIPGSAYVFVKPSGGWTDMTETARLRASDAQSVALGSSVSISGEVVAAGAPYDNDGGSAYVFVKPAGGWRDMEQTARLIASDAADFDLLGLEIAVGGDVVVAGAQGLHSHGSAYIFVRPPGGWADMTQTAKLLPSVPAPFGRSVAIDGDVIVVGGEGSGFIFIRPQGRWEDMTETAVFTAADVENTDNFGSSISISGDVVVVGAPADDDDGLNSGSAYVFASADEWVHATVGAKLTASDAGVAHGFDGSVSVSGDTAVVGVSRFSIDDSRPAYIYGGLPACEGQCRGDCADNDGFVGVVDVVDLLRLLAEWAQASTPCDFDGCGIDLDELVALLDRWGPCPSLADCNGNGVFDLTDVGDGTSLDCNENAVPDECDLADATSADCNGDAIPDECEEDCNGNGVPDECDLADATSADCNGSGVPDECEGGCNDNGVPDECDLANGTSRDYDGNGIPDECDQPANDDCKDAAFITDGTTPFSTLGATTDGTYAVCGGGNNGITFIRDVWFVYTASCTGTATFSICNAVDFDSRLAVYYFASCPTVSAPFCSDDAPGCRETSEVYVPVFEGIPCLVRIGSSEEWGIGVLTVSCRAGP